MTNHPQWQMLCSMLQKFECADFFCTRVFLCHWCYWAKFTQGNTFSILLCILCPLPVRYRLSTRKQTQDPFLATTLDIFNNKCFKSGQAGRRACDLCIFYPKRCTRPLSNSAPPPQKKNYFSTQNLSSLAFPKNFLTFFKSCISAIQNFCSLWHWNFWNFWKFSQRWQKLLVFEML